MSRYGSFLNSVVDALCAGLALTLVRMVYLHHVSFTSGPRFYQWLTILAVIGWWGISLWVGGSSPRWSGFRQDAFDITVIATAGGLLLSFAVFALKLTNASRFTLGMAVVVSWSLMLMARVVRRLYLFWSRRRGQNQLHVLFVGEPAAFSRFLQQVRRHPEAGIRISKALLIAQDGAVEAAAAEGAAEAALDSRRTSAVMESELVFLPQHVERALHEAVVDEVVVALPVAFHEITEQIMLHAAREGKAVRLLIDSYLSNLRRYRMAQWYGQTVLSVGDADERDWQLRLKRLMDVVGSAVLLILLSPVFAAIALAIKLDSPDGPVLFRQVRVGRNGRRFVCLKFRTMVPDAEAWVPILRQRYGVELPVVKLKDDPRITRVGRILRRTSLDELPQLWNVLRGEMSLVGPRPLAPTEVDILDPHVRKRLSLRPGLTCLWQISGRSDTEWSRRMKLDVEYVDRWSILLDLEILLRTVPAVLIGKGAY